MRIPLGVRVHRIFSLLSLYDFYVFLLNYLCSFSFCRYMIYAYLTFSALDSCFLLWWNLGFCWLEPSFVLKHTLFFVAWRLEYHFSYTKRWHVNICLSMVLSVFYWWNPLFRFWALSVFWLVGHIATFLLPLFFCVSWCHGSVFHRPWSYWRMGKKQARFCGRDDPQG